MVTKKKGGKAGKALGVVAIIGLVGYGIYKASEGVEAAPEIITLPDQSSVLYQESLEALRKAQAALDESQALNATYDAALHEHLLAPAESTAIVSPVVTAYADGTVYVSESDAAKAAAEAEALAQKQRDELKRKWQDALNLAQSTLPTLQANASAAVNIYEQKQSKVQSVLSEIERYKNAIMLANTGIQNTTSSAVRDRLLSDFNNYMIQYNAARARLAIAKQEATDKKSDAFALIGMVNDGIERVLTITQGLAIITYVTEVANRVDSIARATREAVGMLQGRLTGVESALIYDEPLNINIVYPVYTEPTPVPVSQVEIAAAAEREVWGVTVAEVKSLQDLALEVNIEMGGRYIGGVLTPPPSWTKSVTEWSRQVQAIALTRFNNQ